MSQREREKEGVQDGRRQGAEGGPGRASTRASTCELQLTIYGTCQSVGPSWLLGWLSRGRAGSFGSGLGLARPILVEPCLAEPRPSRAEPWRHGHVCTELYLFSVPSWAEEWAVVFARSVPSETCREAKSGTSEIMSSSVLKLRPPEI